MKRLLLVVLFTTQIIANSLFAQENKSTIFFRNKACDLGEIFEDKGILNAVFMFSNSGNTPLIIQRVVSSCDCAVVDWPKEPILPGARSDIKVAFNPKGRVGKFEKLITVYSNADQPTVVLTLSGVVKEKQKELFDIYNRVVGDFRFKNTLASFNRMYNDEERVDTVLYIYTGKESAKIGARLNNLPYLKVKFVPEIIKPNEKGLILVYFDAKAKNDWGFVAERFSLTQNDKDIVGSMITVTASIEENFSALNEVQRANAPKIDMAIQNFEFGEVVEGDLIEKDFEFTNVGKSDLIIRKIKASCGCTTVEPADKIIRPGKSSSVKASVKTNGFSGRIAKTVTIITNDPLNPSVVIRFTATVLPKNSSVK